MNKENKVNDESLEKAVGAYKIDEDGNKYYIGFGIDGDSCVCCGNCASMCPAMCIDLSSGVAKIDYNLCVRCDYCLGSCPTEAISYNCKVIVG